MSRGSWRFFGAISSDARGRTKVVMSVRLGAGGWRARRGRGRGLDRQGEMHAAGVRREGVLGGMGSMTVAPAQLEPPGAVDGTPRSAGDDGWYDASRPRSHDDRLRLRTLASRGRDHTPALLVHGQPPLRQPHRHQAHPPPRRSVDPDLIAPAVITGVVSVGLRPLAQSATEATERRLSHAGRMGGCLPDPAAPLPLPAGQSRWDRRGARPVPAACAVRTENSREHTSRRRGLAIAMR